VSARSETMNGTMLANDGIPKKYDTASNTPPAQKQLASIGGILGESLGKSGSCEFHESLD